GGAVVLVGHGAGGGGTAGDIAGPGAQQSAVGAVGPAGAEFRNRAALGGPDDAVGLGGNQALVVQAQEHEGLNKLGLDGGGPDRENGLSRENGRPLRNSPDVAGEGEVFQIVQKLLCKAVLG